MLTEEEYNTPINIKTKQIDNFALAMKFHHAMIQTIKKVFITDNNYIYSILDGKKKIKKVNKDYRYRQYSTAFSINLEKNRKLSVKHWYSNMTKNEIQVFNIDLNRNINNTINNSLGVSNWEENYYQDFIKFTSLQSKNFKKKLTKAMYIFENEPSDRKYRVIFNFLVNYFNMNINKYISNFDNKTGKIIDDTMTNGWVDCYYITKYERILETRENRNKSINDILKTKDLVDNDN